MTYTITNDCISCQRCLSACPTDAIQTNGANFWIDVDRCNHCQDTYSVAQCWAVCPTNEGCVPLSTATTAVGLTAKDPTDYWNKWFANYSRLVARLNAAEQSSYWQQWFDSYAKALKHLQAQSNAGIPLMP